MSPFDPFSETTIKSAREGVAAHYINCSSNPYDLRPAANIIVGAATKMRAELPDDVPLVILIAETHNISAHLELQHLVAATFHDQGTAFAQAMERPCNALAHMMTEGMGLDVGRGVGYYDSLIQFDPRGTASLAASIVCMHPEWAPVAEKNFNAFLYHNDIPTIFNDAARDYSLNMAMLDITDPLVEAGALIYTRDDEYVSDAVSSSGMAVRNWGMVKRGLAFMQDHQLDLMIQNSGAHHMLGCRSDGYGYAESLSALYQKNGAAVLNVFLASPDPTGGIGIIPEDGRADLARGVLIEGVAGEIFCDRDYDGEDRDKYNYQDGAEQAFITEKLHRESGHLLQFFDIAAHKDEYEEEAIKHCIRVEKLYHAVRNKLTP
ncbi:hypothetical protein [Micavibrio aeruginosavorus]|uniref:hypothetical protein n=1 Tax=Micavibrio aeruginosavorus TaxID=349221 RepID=UPI003F4A96E2